MIPIRNLYYMLAYALNHLQEIRNVDLSGVQAETPQDLLALVLSRGVSRLLRRGIDRDYLVFEEAIPGVRGRIDIDQTVKTALLARGRIRCRFDELSNDILPNRIIAATFASLRRLNGLSHEVRRELEMVSSRFPKVTPLRISAGDFGQVVIHRNNRSYRFLLDICRLIHENLLSDSSEPGALRFRDFRREEAVMHRLFEEFVRNFLDAEQEEFSVDRRKVRWDVSDADEYSLAHLPEMETDMVLENRELVRIIDTKYYLEPLVRHQSGAKLHSPNLYQILSYVENWVASNQSPGKTVEGMLLYAGTGEGFSFDYRIGGNRIRAASIVLDQDWDELRDQLVTMCTESESFPREQGGAVVA